jgi:hypothetical protein
MMKLNLIFVHDCAGIRCPLIAASISLTGGQRQIFVVLFNQLEDTIETVFSPGKNTTEKGFNVDIWEKLENVEVMLTAQKRKVNWESEGVGEEETKISLQNQTSFTIRENFWPSF